MLEQSYRQLQYTVHMDLRKALSACCKHWKISSNSCCSKKILLLLVWQALFSFSNNLIIWCAAYLNFTSPVLITASQFVSGVFAPLIGWLADVKIGRYETIKFGSLVSFIGSIFFYKRYMHYQEFINWYYSLDV